MTFVPAGDPQRTYVTLCCSARGSTDIENLSGGVVSAERDSPAREDQNIPESKIVARVREEKSPWRARTRERGGLVSSSPDNLRILKTGEDESEDLRSSVKEGNNRDR